MHSSDLSIVPISVCQTGDASWFEARVEAGE